MTLHSSRRAWAEWALKWGYPERFAQQALGHNCKAVHHAFSKNTEITVPSLDDWEKGWRKAEGARRKAEAEDRMPDTGFQMPAMVPVDFQVAQRSQGGVTGADLGSAMVGLGWLR